jgi:hypothetical protein
MSIFGEMQHDGPIDRTAPETGIPLRIVLAGSVAGSLLLMPALTEAAFQSAKPAHAPKTVVVSAAPQSATNAQPRVSPYAIANKQRAAEARSRLSATQLPVRRVSR